MDMSKLTKIVNVVKAGLSLRIFFHEDRALHQGKYLQPNFEVKSVELLSC